MDVIPTHAIAAPTIMWRRVVRFRSFGSTVVFSILIIFPRIVVFRRARMGTPEQPLFKIILLGDRYGLWGYSSTTGYLLQALYAVSHRPSRRSKAPHN